MVQSIEEARRRQNNPAGRTPPHDLAAEQSVLGAMLLSREAISVAMEQCHAGDFYKPAHGHVFEAISNLYGEGEPVDPVTVADELRRAGLLEAIGGTNVLIDLLASTPSTANAGRYGRIVADHSLLRRLIGAANEIADLGYDIPDDVHGAIDRAESMVFDIGQRRVADTLSPLRDLLAASLDRLEALYERGDAITGVPTGYLDIDEQLAGLQNSNLLVVGARPSIGKALALDTPIPTPEGWKSMGTLAVGDEVYDDQGRPCDVLYTSPVYVDHDCYRVRFDDGTEIVADAGHRWLAYDHPAWKSFRQRARLLRKGPPPHPRLARDQSTRWRPPRVVTTEEMLAEGVTTGDGRPNWYLPLAGPLEAPEVDLPVDPYVLGCWLGDGHPATSPMNIGQQDQDHFVAEFERRGYPLTGRSELELSRVELHRVGLLPGNRKHIPGGYLRASAKQRLELLQGLMDTDGSVSATTGVAELAMANLALVEQARELVLSLGHKPNQIRYHPIRLGPGRIAESWRFTWTPRDPVFLLERKARAQASGASGREFGPGIRRRVVSIEAVPTVPVRCISVSSSSHLFLAGDGMVPTHNTAFALGIASHAAMHANVPTLFFSLEMSHLEITQRLLSSEAQVNASRMRNGKLHESDWPKISHAIGRLGEAPLFIDDNPNLTIMDMRAKARRLKSRDGLGLIIVDYVQLMTGRSAENRQVEVSEISRGLKILARELEVPVVALSQLSRSLEQRADKRPMLADLRESGAIEQDADVVMFLYRDEVYNADSPDRGTAEVIVAKHRNGPTGTARLAFLDHYAKFANMAREA
jgi:replicative DNA helicase